MQGVDNRYLHAHAARAAALNMSALNVAFAIVTDNRANVATHPSAMAGKAPANVLLAAVFVPALQHVMLLWLTGRANGRHTRPAR